MPASDFQPHYRRIMAHIRSQIASGAWPPGYQLPSSRELTGQFRELYGVRSATTVRHAIEILIETGELRGHQGLGVFVSDQPA